MSLRIIRWKGCHRGDVVLNAITTCNTTVKTNFNNVTLPNVDRISQPKYVMDDVVYADLKEELERLENDTASWVIKSHYYSTTIFDSVTLDIIAEPMYLPFVVLANICTTETLNSNYNNLVSKITDPDILYKYAMYNVAKDCSVNQTSTTKQLETKDLLLGFGQFKKSLALLDIKINDDAFEVYKWWFADNEKYLPSPEYQEQIRKNDYTITNPKLSLCECYCLLALSGQKFQLLEDR